MYKRQIQFTVTPRGAGLPPTLGDWMGLRWLGEKGEMSWCCLLYTSDAADERSSVDLGGRRIIKKKKDNGQGGGQDSEEK